MVTLSPPLRRATAADAAALADLVNFAGEGLPEYLWNQMAAEGEDPWELGRRRQALKAAEGKIFVVDEGAGAVAALTGYPTPAEPESLPDEPMFRPLQELENLAPSTWYVNVVAAYPQERGRGHGTRLLALAEEISRDLGLGALSLIVADGNAGARRLYKRMGYGETARRAIFKGGWACGSDQWVLLIKPP